MLAQGEGGSLERVVSAHGARAAQKVPQVGEEPTVSIGLDTGIGISWSVLRNRDV